MVIFLVLKHKLLKLKGNLKEYAIYSIIYLQSSLLTYNIASFLVLKFVLSCYCCPACRQNCPCLFLTSSLSPFSSALIKPSLCSGILTLKPCYQSSFSIRLCPYICNSIRNVVLKLVYWRILLRSRRKYISKHHLSWWFPYNHFLTTNELFEKRVILMLILF